VVLGGDEWIWNLAREHFPGAIQSVDLFHARQHLWDVVRLLYAHHTKRRNAWIGLHQKRWLDQGKIAKLVESLRQIQTTRRRAGQENSERGRLLRHQPGSHELSQFR
jgi:transposase